MERTHEMNLEARAEVVKAMDTLVNCINDEEIIDSWLMLGVADGDIKKDTPLEYMECYCEDDTFKGLMSLFLKLMYRARIDGLYCDKVTSQSIKIKWE